MRTESVTEDGGITKVVLQEGEGDVIESGRRVSVHYVGTLVGSGRKFDSSRDRGTPFEFDLGAMTVIKCWELGIASMRKGERALLTCSSDYAYGSRGIQTMIPPGATLQFDVEVLDDKEAVNRCVLQ